MNVYEKPLSYQELIELARQHYNEGGSATYECADEKWFNDYVDQFGPMTKAKALNMFRIDKALDDIIIASSW